jgi:hypothetical protein
MDRLAEELGSLLCRLDALGVSATGASPGLRALPPLSADRLRDYLAMGQRAAERFWAAEVPDRPVYGVRALRELRAAVAVLQEWTSGD